MVHAAMLRSPHAHARITRHRRRPRAKGARRRRRVHRRRHRGVATDAVRLARAERRAQGREISVHCHATSSATSATSSPSSSPRRRLRPTTRSSSIEVDYEPLPCGRSIRRRPARTRRAAAARRRAEQQRFPLDGRRRRRRRRVRERRGRRQGAHRPAAADSERDGAARGAGASGRGASGELTLWNTTQNPHILRFLTSVVTGVPEDKLRVIAPEVGGGFGSKIAAYPADFLTVFCSRCAQSPGQVERDAQRELSGHDARPRSHPGSRSSRPRKTARFSACARRRGRRMGAYLSTAAPGIPTILHGLMFSGVYNIPGDQGGRLRRLHQQRRRSRRIAAPAVPKRRSWSSG